MERLRAAAAHPSSSERLAATLRSACLARVRESRTTLLTTLRGASAARADGDAAGLLAQHVRQLVAQELSRARADDTAGVSCADVDQPMSAEDALWSSDGTAPSHTVFTRRAATVGEQASPEEAVALSRELEDFITASLREEEAAILAEYEASQAFDHAAVQAAADALDLWESEESGAESKGSDEDVAVLCPVCRMRRLHALRGVIFCACGGLRLELSCEGLGLPQVSQLLGAALEEHLRGGCAHTPRFVQQQGWGGTENLVATCRACQAFVTVL